MKKVVNDKLAALHDDVQFEILLMGVKFLKSQHNKSALESI